VFSFSCRFHPPFCHFDGGEISTSSSTKISNLAGRISCVISPFGRNDKLDENIVMKTIGLAPIEVEILLWRGSPQKIETDSGISSLLKMFLS